MKSKKAMAMILTATMGLSLMACGSSRGTGEKADSTSSSKTVSSEAEKSSDAELKIWIAGTGDATSDQTYRSIFDSWIADEAPDSSYELSFISWGEYATKLSVALASGEGPDIFMSGYGMFGSFQAQDYMLNLSEHLPESWDGYTDIGENFLNAGKVDGDIYGLLEPSTRVFMYRKDIAEQNGVTEEDLQIDSLEDLENLANKMCVKDQNGNLQMSGLELMTTAGGPNDPAQIFSVISRNEDVSYGLWDSDGAASFNNEAGIAAMTYIKNLYDEGVSLPSESGDNTNGLVSGLAAMSITSESAYGTADAAFPGQIAIAPSSLNSLLIGNFFCINKDTKYADQAVELLIYMFNADSCKKKAEGLGMYTMRESLKSWYQETFPEMATVPEYYDHSYAYSDTAIPYFNEAITIFRNSSELIMASDADITETFADAEAQWNALKDQQ